MPISEPLGIMGQEVSIGFSKVAEVDLGWQRRAFIVLSSITLNLNRLKISKKDLNAH